MVIGTFFGLAGETVHEPQLADRRCKKLSTGKKQYGRLVVKILNAKPARGGEAGPLHGTVGLLSEEGREYASPIAPRETVIFYYVRKPSAMVKPQLEFQIYSGTGLEVPHRFRRRLQPGSKGEASVSSPSSPPRFQGEGVVAIHKEWPRRSILEKPGVAQTEPVEIFRDGQLSYTLDVSLQFVPDRGRDSGPDMDDSVAPATAEDDDDSAGEAISALELPTLSPNSGGNGVLRSWNSGKEGGVGSSGRQVADAAGGGSSGTPSWALADAKGARSEVDYQVDDAERGSISTGKSPWGGSEASRKMEEIEKKNQLTEAEWRVFQNYDRDHKGYMTAEEFKAFLRDMRASGLSVENLSAANKGCCGLLVSLPGEALGNYILHNHSIFSVCYGNGNEKMRTTILDRLFLVVIVFLYSASLTCALAQLLPQVPYVYRVVGQSIIDAFGLVFITTIFSIAHRKSCPDWGRYLGDTILGVVFLALLTLLYLRAQKLDQAVTTLRTLLPNWIAGRCTEIFKVAAVWGYRVQYGSAHGAF